MSSVAFCIVMLSVVVLTAVMLSADVFSVVAPKKHSVRECFVNLKFSIQLKFLNFPKFWRYDTQQHGT